MPLKTRKTAAKGEVLGIPYTYNDPPYWDAGRCRSRLLIKNPRTGKTEITAVLTGSGPEAVLGKIASEVKSFPQEKADQLVRWILQGDYDPSLAAYGSIRGDRITARLSRSYRADRFAESWNLVRPVFSQIPLSQITTDPGLARKTIRDAMDSVFRRSVSKHAAGENERLAWIVLEAVLKTMVEDGVLDLHGNPLPAILPKNGRPETTQISRVFRARSFSGSQAARYWSLVHGLEDEDLQCALMVHYLLGMNRYELCALDLDSYHPARRDSPAFLTIAREYYQKRGSPPEMRDPDSYNQYRNLPCSAVLEEILNIQLKRRKKQGAGNDDPLFLYEGSRLTPNEIKKVENALISEAFAGSAFDPARTDFIRTNARWHFLNTCSMLPAEAAYLQGIDRVTTYARSYVDWRSAMILSALAGKLDRWHYTEPLVPASRKQADTAPSLRIISGTVSSPAQIRIGNRHGFTLSFRCRQEKSS